MHSRNDVGEIKVESTRTSLFFTVTTPAIYIKIDRDINAISSNIVTRERALNSANTNELVSEFLQYLLSHDIFCREEAFRLDGDVLKF